MAQWHLDELREALEKRGWRLMSELPGDDYAISASWEMAQSGKPHSVILDFHGLDDMKTLPVTESYACYVRGSRHSLYLRRRGRKGSSGRELWRRELAAFVAGVDTHAI